jgi:cytochrome d ubiquinol oxidase subunit II
MTSASIGLPEIIAGLIVLALNAYALLGGADFGGGVWDLLASGPRKEEQRTLIADSIAPIWEANHVWLIIVVVMLFTAFPSAFSTLGIVLHIPISLLLIGIVLRGSAFVFRSYGSRTKERRKTWGLAFAVASTAAPLLLGAIIGAIASGDVGDASRQVGRASFGAVFVAPWTSPFAISVGVFALVQFAYLAAVYSTIAAHTDGLRDDFRRRSLIVAVLLFVVAALTLVMSLREGVASNVLSGTWSIPLHVVTGLAAMTAIAALWRRRYQVARIAAAFQVSCIIWGWALAQFPYVIPTPYVNDGTLKPKSGVSLGLTIRDAAAPSATLDLLLIGLIVGFVVLVPSLAYLYRTFTRRSSLADQGAHGTE